MSRTKQGRCPFLIEEDDGIWVCGRVLKWAEGHNRRRARWRCRLGHQVEEVEERRGLGKDSLTT